MFIRVYTHIQTDAYKFMMSVCMYISMTSIVYHVLIPCCVQLMCVEQQNKRSGLLVEIINLQTTSLGILHASFQWSGCLIETHPSFPLSIHPSPHPSLTHPFFTHPSPPHPSLTHPALSSSIPYSIHPLLYPSCSSFASSIDHSTHPSISLIHFIHPSILPIHPSIPSIYFIHPFLHFIHPFHPTILSIISIHQL